MLDEPVSALDVSIQAQIVNLLEDLQDEFELTYLFVAHDLSVVRHVSDRIAVMYLGKIMELSPSEELYAKPIHPYTAALLSAIPVPDPRENRRRERIVVGGEPPSPVDPPSGCVFHTRCPRARDLCKTEVPRLSEYANGHVAACHYPLNVTREEIARVDEVAAQPARQRRHAADGRRGRRPTAGVASAARAHDVGAAARARSASSRSEVTTVTPGRGPLGDHVVGVRREGDARRGRPAGRGRGRRRRRRRARRSASARSSSWLTRRCIAPARSRHQPSGREPMTLLPSTSHI